jgi:TRAP-type mannitol/chloroaromatic compound transport system substrate-binding protein
MKKITITNRSFVFAIEMMMVLALLVTPLASAQADSPKTYNWKMAVNSAQNENYYRVASEAAKQVKIISNNRINIQIFPMGQIVPITEAWEAVNNGTMELALVFPGYHVGKMPVADVESGLPFTLDNELELRMFWHDYGFLNFLNTEVYSNTNTYVLGQVYFPGYSFWLKKPVATIADLKGMKLRIAGPISKILGKLEIPTTFVPGPEMYSALSTGILDGAAYGSLTTGYDLKFYEVTKYILSPRVQAVAQCSIYINKDLFNSLPEDLKELMKAFALRINDGLNRDFDQREVKIMNSLQKEKGLKLTRLDDNAYKALEQASAEYRKDMAKQNPLTAKAIEMLENFLGDIRVK